MLALVELKSVPRSEATRLVFSPASSRMPSHPPMSVSYRAPAGKFTGSASRGLKLTIFSGAASQAVMHGSNMCAGVHARSTFRMLRHWRRASIFRHDGKTERQCHRPQMSLNSCTKYEPTSEMSPFLSMKLGFVHITTTGVVDGLTTLLENTQMGRLYYYKNSNGVLISAFRPMSDQCRE